MEGDIRPFAFKYVVLYRVQGELGYSPGQSWACGWGTPPRNDSSSSQGTHSHTLTLHMLLGDTSSPTHMSLDSEDTLCSYSIEYVRLSLSRCNLLPKIS